MNRELTLTERTQFKERLYRKLRDISEYHSDVEASRHMTLEQMVEAYCYWADEYNDRYMPEMDKDDTFSNYMKTAFLDYTGENFSKIIKTKEELIALIKKEYENNPLEASSVLLRNVDVMLSKADFFEAYSEIEKIVTGYGVSIYDKQTNNYKDASNVQTSWKSQMVIGNAEQILEDIQKEVNSENMIMLFTVGDKSYEEDNER